MLEGNPLKHREEHVTKTLRRNLDKLKEETERNFGDPIQRRALAYTLLDLGASTSSGIFYEY
jgi:hypothetical protein